MARKKRALKAEVVDEAGEVNLSGTTRLDFSLTKNDIIDYYLQEQEDELEAEIKDRLQSIIDLDKEAEAIRAEFDLKIENTVLKANKTLIKNVKKALEKLSALGFRPSGGTERVSVRFNGLKVTATNLPAFAWGNERRYGNRKALGSKLPVDLWNSDGYAAQQFFCRHNKIHNLAVEDDVSKTSAATLNVGGAYGPETTVEWDKKLSTLADTYVQKLNDKATKARELFGLILRHDSLPSLKKQIKKQVVGRVLRNTDEGKLMLQALKGMRSSGANLLTVAASDS